MALEERKPMDVDFVVESIVKAMQKPNAPEKPIIKMFLEKWEAEIRYDQVMQDKEMSQKVIDKVFGK